LIGWWYKERGKRESRNKKMKKKKISYQRNMTREVLEHKKQRGEKWHERRIQKKEVEGMRR
jgi:hypothetical protein